MSVEFEIKFRATPQQQAAEFVGQHHLVHQGQLRRLGGALCRQFHGTMELILAESKVEELHRSLIFAGEKVLVLGMDKHHRVGVERLALAVDVVQERALLHQKDFVIVVAMQAETLCIASHMSAHTSGIGVNVFSFIKHFMFHINHQYHNTTKNTSCQ